MENAIDNPDREKIVEYFNTNLKPILDKYNTTYFFDPDGHLKKPKQGVFAPGALVTINKEQDTVELKPLQFQKSKELEWMLKNWDELQTIVESITQHDPFHSDIHRAFTVKWKRREQREHNSLAYCYVCDKLSKSGRRIHSD